MNSTIISGLKSIPKKFVKDLDAEVQTKIKDIMDWYSHERFMLPFNKRNYLMYACMLKYLNELIPDTWIEYNPNYSYRTNPENYDVKFIGTDDKILTKFPNKVIIKCDKIQCSKIDGNYTDIKLIMTSGKIHQGLYLTYDRIWKTHSWVVLHNGSIVDSNVEPKLLYMTFTTKDQIVNFNKQ